MFSTSWSVEGQGSTSPLEQQNAMPGPSLQDSGPSPDPLSEREASLDRQLKAWFDALLQAPVPNDLLRHIDRLQAGDEKAR